MANKNASNETDSFSQPPADGGNHAEDFPLTLDEFCSRLSKSDRRVELIGGFHSAEKLAGTTKDTDAAFSVRFAAFCNQPA